MIYCETARPVSECWLRGSLDPPDRRVVAVAPPGCGPAARPRGGTRRAAGSTPAAPLAPQTAVDTAILTEWSLPTSPAARGPWQIKWDDTSSKVRFTEGNHTSVNRVASLNPSTHQLQEWGIPNSSEVHGIYVDSSGNIWFTYAFTNKIGRRSPPPIPSPLGP